MCGGRPPPHTRFLLDPPMDASDPPQKKQRTDAGPSGPEECNLPPDRFLDVLLAGEDDDAPIAVVAACMRTRDLGLTLHELKADGELTELKDDADLIARHEGRRYTNLVGRKLN